jgi:hypothetical protein
LQISSDNSPEFITELYTNLRILNQDLYKRLSLGGAGGPHGGGGGAAGPSALGASLTNSGPGGLSTVGESALPAMGGYDSEKDGENFSTPQKLRRHNSRQNNRSQPELALVASLEKAREHMKDDRQRAVSQSQHEVGAGAGAGAAGYFTNRAMQERIKVYSRQGAGAAAVPTDFFNRYMTEDEQATVIGLPVGLQRYDSNSNLTAGEKKEDGSRRKHRRHSLGGSFDKDAMSVPAAEGAPASPRNSDKSAEKADGFLRPVPTPGKVAAERVNSLRGMKS